MSTTSKSIKRLLSVSQAVAERGLPRYSSHYSRKAYTLRQLFSCLVLKTFLKTDYRGVCEFLSDFKEVRELLDMQQAPHYTTLQKANNRIMGQANIKRLFQEIFEEYQFKKMGLGLTSY